VHLYVDMDIVFILIREKEAEING